MEKKKNGKKTRKKKNEIGMKQEWKKENIGITAPNYKY